MKNRDTWKPSKYVYKHERLAASRDPREVGVGSRLVSDLIAEIYSNNLQHHAKGYLLDLGCGKVPLFHAYRDYISDNYCVDWVNTQYKSEHIDLEHDLTKPLPFQDGEFDTIILSDVLEHLPQPENLFGEMSRVLSSNGKIIMNVPFYYWLHEQPHDYYRYTQFALRRFVEISGLKLIQLDTVGGVPEIMTDLFAKTILVVPKIGRFLSSFAQYLTASFIKTRIGKKLSDRSKDGFPLVYFMVAQKPQ